jgi:hypothetical protein
MESSYVVSGISHSDDSLLKVTAYQTVMDSLYHTGLSDITPALIRSGDTLRVSGYSSCDWYIDDSLVSIHSSFIAMTRSGAYSAVVHGGSGCTIQTLRYSESVISSIADISHIPVWSVQPNPAHDRIVISGAAGHEISLYDAMGAEVLRIATTGTHTAIDLSLLPRGLYLVRADTGWSVREVLD